MASYIEMHDVRNQQDLVRKIHVAICDVAFDILAPESGTTQARSEWAKAAIQRPDSVTPEIIHYVLIANKAFTAAQITGASDANVKTAVNKLVGAAS